MQQLSSETLLIDAFDHFYVPRKLRGRSPKTTKQYHLSIDRLADFLDRPPRLDDLTEDTMARFLVWRRLKIQAPTANKDRSQLLAIANFAAKRGVILSPDIDPEPEPERIPKAWLQDDLKKLFASCAAEPGKLCGVHASLWWRGLQLTIWDTGERIGAMMDCRWEWLDFQSGWLVIPAESRKGRARDKAYHLHDETLGVLMVMQKPARELIFQWPYCETYLWTKYNALLARAGLPTDRRSKFHRLRKSVASHGKAAGLDPTALMDHSSPQVTRKYLDPRLTAGKQPSDVLFRPG